MKKLPFTFITIALFSTGLVHADIELNLSEGVSLLAINGKVANENNLFNKQSNYKIPDGENQILITYTVEIKKGSEDELETSHPAVITFQAKGQTLALTTPDISSENAMKEFNHDLNWVLTQGDGQNVEFQTALLPLKGFRLGVDYSEELEKFNRSSNLAAIAPKNNLLPVGTESSTNTEQAIILKMLKHWYNIASPETQNQFIQELRNK